MTGGLLPAWGRYLDDQGKSAVSSDVDVGQGAGRPPRCEDVCCGKCTDECALFGPSFAGGRLNAIQDVVASGLEAEGKPSFIADWF